MSALSLAKLVRVDRDIERKCYVRNGARPFRNFSSRRIVAAGSATVQDAASLKVDLLALVAGLDRGLSVSESEVEKVNRVAGLLECAGSGVRLGEGEDLQGRWRLLFSSAFVSGSLGGRRPGPPVGFLPFSLGQVYQRIDVLARELDNIVELQINTPWPFPPIRVTATLAHTFEISGDNKVTITFEKTSTKFGGGLSQLPPFEIPQLPNFLRPSPSLRSGSFECTYVDGSMRISRGDRGELRIFVVV